MKKLLSLGLALALALGLSACATGDPPASSSAPAPAAGLRLGIIQLATHPALDAACQGFLDGLADAGYVEGENLSVDLQNAENDADNCPPIAQALVAEGCDLILAIATPAAQAAAEATGDIPILVTAVTDPAGAGLVESNEAPRTNVTGTSDLTPIPEQLALLKALVPEAETVGFLHSSEANSLIQLEMAIEAARALGLAYEDYPIADEGELGAVIASMAGAVDAIYAPTDNTIATHIDEAAALAIQHGLPFIVGEEGQVDRGGLASVSVNYYALGQQTAEMALPILAGTATPADTPIQYQQEYQNIFNLDTADALGISIPEEL